jgi:hypothetical protein
MFQEWKREIKSCFDHPHIWGYIESQTQYILCSILARIKNQNKRKNQILILKMLNVQTNYQQNQQKLENRINLLGNLDRPALRLAGPLGGGRDMLRKLVGSAVKLPY